MLFTMGFSYGELCAFIARNIGPGVKCLLRKIQGVLTNSLS